MHNITYLDINYIRPLYNLYPIQGCSLIQGIFDTLTDGKHQIDTLDIMFHESFLMETQSGSNQQCHLLCKN